MQRVRRNWRRNQTQIDLSVAAKLSPKPGPPHYFLIMAPSLMSTPLPIEEVACWPPLSQDACIIIPVRTFHNHIDDKLSGQVRVVSGGHFA